MRFRAYSLAIALGAGSTLLLPLVAHATGIPYFGPIVPPEVASCPANWGAAVQLINNIIAFLITIGIFFIAPLMIAYAGFLFVVNPVNASGKEQAKSMLWNVVIGIVIMMSAYLIVDTGLTALTTQGVEGWTNQIFSTSGGFCLPVAGSLNQSQGVNASGITPSAQVGVAGPLCSSGNSACSVSALEAAGLTNVQATTMSCIAVTESSGNPATPDSNTGACGTFQITNRPGNWSNPAYHKPPCSVSSSCNNAACNLQTAVIMFKEQGYQPWTGKNPNGTYWNPNAVACMQKYDPGH